MAYKGLYFDLLGVKTSNTELLARYSIQFTALIRFKQKNDEIGKPILGARLFCIQCIIVQAK